MLADLDGAIDLVLDAGATDVGVESTIVDCTVTPPVVRRAGGVTLEQLPRRRADRSPIETLDGAAEHAQVAPGQLLRHYAPAAPVTVFAASAEAVSCGGSLPSAAHARRAAGRRVGVLAPEEDLLALAPALAARRRRTAGSWSRRWDGAATRPQPRGGCSPALRPLDDRGVDVIVASGPDRQGLGRGCVGSAAAGGRGPRRRV